MSVAGAVAAAIRRESPYGDWLAMGARFIADPGGFRTGGRPYYHLLGRDYRRFKDIPGAQVARNGDAYDFGAGGRVCRSAAGEAREIPYVGLNHNEERATLIVNNADLSAASFSNNGGSASAAGEGVIGARVEIVSGGADWNRRQLISSVPSVVGGTPYAVTMAIEPGTSGQVRLALYNSVGGTITIVGGAPAAPAAISQGAGTVTGLSSTLRGGVYWITFVWTPNFTGSIAQTGLGASSNTAGHTVYAHYFNIEAGGYVLPPVVSGASNVVRPADNLRITGVGGVLAAPFTKLDVVDIPAIDGVARRISTVSDGTSSQRMTLIRDSDNALKSGIFSEPTVGTNFSIAGKTGARTIKSIQRLLPNERALGADGAALIKAVESVLPSMSRIDFGQLQDGTSSLNGTHRLMAIFGELSDVQCGRLIA